MSSKKRVLESQVASSLMPLDEPSRLGIVVEGAPGGRSERPLAFRQKQKCNGALRAPQLQNK